jgi:hypothetical protein
VGHRLRCDQNHAYPCLAVRRRCARWRPAKERCRSVTRRGTVGLVPMTLLTVLPLPVLAGFGTPASALPVPLLTGLPRPMLTGFGTPPRSAPGRGPGEGEHAPSRRGRRPVGVVNHLVNDGARCDPGPGAGGGWYATQCACGPGAGGGLYANGSATHSGAGGGWYANGGATHSGAGGHTRSFNRLPLRFRPRGVWSRILPRAFRPGGHHYAWLRAPSTPAPGHRMRRIHPLENAKSPIHLTFRRNLLR